MSNERLILCAGAKAPKSVKSEIVYLDPMDRDGRKQNVFLKIQDISERMAANIPDLLTDLLEVAAYVYCADHATTRGGNEARNMGAKWRRHLHFVVPVREPDKWSAARAVLEETLGFLSEDEFHFDFEKLKKPPPVQQYLEFGDSRSHHFAADEVLLFSGGLDSLAGAVEEMVGNGRRVALVSHRSAPKMNPRLRDLVSDLRGHCKDSGRLLHVPVWVRKSQRLSRDYSTQRTRSFLYASLAAVVARMLGLSKLCFFENGVTSLNLPITEQVIGARATRTTHPQAIENFGRFFSALLGEQFSVDNLFIWKTKSDVVRTIADHGCADLIRHSISCSRVFDVTKLKTHCGKCSQCIERRFAVLAEGLAKHDPWEMYDVDLLTGERKDGEPRTMLESYLKTATEAEQMTDIQFFTKYGEIARVLRHLPGTTDENASKIIDLYRRHADSVLGAIDKGIQEHASELRAGTLPESCTLVLALPKEYRTAPLPVAAAPAVAPTKPKISVDDAVHFPENDAEYEEIKRDTTLLIDLRKRRVFYKTHEVPTHPCKPARHLQKQALAVLATLALRHDEPLHESDLNDEIFKLGLLDDNMGSNLRDIRRRIVGPFEDAVRGTNIPAEEVKDLVKVIRGMNQILLRVAGSVRVIGMMAKAAAAKTGGKAASANPVISDPTEE